LVFTGNNQISENGITLASTKLHSDELLITEIDLEHLEHERRVRNTFVTTNDKEYRYIDFDIELGDTTLTREIEKMPFVPAEGSTRDMRSEEILMLQCLGLKQRLRHINCRKAVIGLSGGLDSTLALMVAVRTFDMMGFDRKGIICVTMPCFGTTERTKNNAVEMANRLGCTLRVVNIAKAVTGHFEDIGQDMEKHDTAFENAQARERTQVLMDIANMEGGIVIGTGDLSELALGWATYNGDHMSMYGINSSVPKTLVKQLVSYCAKFSDNWELAEILRAVVEEPISPELLPGSHKTEDIIGPYELHDFFIYHVLRWGSSPSKVYRLACYAFEGEYDEGMILKCLRTFYKRFFSQQFKRSCLPDGPKIGSIALSPRGDWRMPSDAAVRIWQDELEESLD
ncbi:MAG: NAD(+) synthase, partial [Spirochaetales bacterium]